MAKKAVSIKLLKTAQPIIEDIIERNHNASFAYYTQADIKQEIWALCMDALSRFNPDVGSLENFLRNHVSNRLKNLKRDKYFRRDKDSKTSEKTQTRINIVNALPVGVKDMPPESIPLTHSSVAVNPLDELIAEDLKDYLQKNIPQEFLIDFEILITGGTINKRRLEPLREIIEVLMQNRDSNDR